MKRFKRERKLFIKGRLILNLCLMTYVNKSGGKTLDIVAAWTEDCEDISDWTDARTTELEDNTIGNYGIAGSWGLTDNVIASGGVFTPDTNWWNPPASDTKHRQGAYS